MNCNYKTEWPDFEGCMACDENNTCNNREAIMVHGHNKCVEVANGNKKTADELKEMPFPDCASVCSAIKELGAGECDSVCPEKHKNTLKDPRGSAGVECMTCGEDTYWSMGGTLRCKGCGNRPIYCVCMIGGHKARGVGNE